MLNHISICFLAQHQRQKHFFDLFSAECTTGMVWGGWRRLSAMAIRHYGIMVIRYKL